MTDGELEELLCDLESDRVERKASLSSPDRVREAICAFANDLPGHGKPGVIFVGAEDTTGDPTGIAVTDKLLRDLALMRDDGGIQPFPSMSVQKRRLKGVDIAVVIVFPSTAPPIRFKGRTWVRVGPRRAIATPEEERRLSERRRGRDLPFDLQPLFSASSSDLDMLLFERTYLPAAIAPDVLAANERTPEDQLRALRFLSPEGPPTVMGILVLGKEPRQFVPGFYVQFLRIDGCKLVDPILNQKEIAGALPDILRRLDDILETNVQVATSITEVPVEVRRPDYPLPALQQLSRNAIMHRTYEGTNAPVRLYWFRDRVEIHSPGGPFGQVNRNNFGQPGVTDYRNPHLAEAMKTLGYVQRFAMGIPIARRALEDNGNPPPEFLVEDANVVVIARCRP